MVYDTVLFVLRSQPLMILSAIVYPAAIRGQIQESTGV